MVQCAHRNKRRIEDTKQGGNRRRRGLIFISFISLPFTKISRPFPGMLHLEELVAVEAL
jgi:hypothetical protein